jgi:hypothetical protein
MLGLCHYSAWWLVTEYNLLDTSWVVSCLRMMACHCEQYVQDVFGCVMAPHGGLSLCTIYLTCLGLSHGSAWWLVTVNNLFDMSLVVSWLRMVACHNLFVMSWVVSWLHMGACHSVQSVQHVFGCVIAPHGGLSPCTICLTCLGLCHGSALWLVKICLSCLGLCHGSAWWLVTVYNLIYMSLVVSWL